MSISCSQCGKEFKSGPFANYHDLPSLSYQGVCRGCAAKIHKQGAEDINSHNEATETDSSRQAGSVTRGVNPFYINTVVKTKMERVKACREPKFPP